VQAAILEYRKRKQVTEEGNQDNSVDENLRRLLSFFLLVLNAALVSLTPERCRLLYLGQYNDHGKLVRHGAVTKPKKGSERAVDDVSDGWEDETRAAATHQNELKAAIAFLDWCVEEKFIPSNPAKGVKLTGKRGSGKTKLSGEETGIFIQAAMRLVEQGDIGALASLLALVLAMRAGEILGLVRRAIDMDFTVITVIRGKTKPSERSLELPMESEVGRFLQACLRHLCEGLLRDQLVFPGERGGRRLRTWLRQATHRICAAAGITVVTTHGLRATHLTLAEERGVTASAMVKQAGHSRQVQEKHYLASGSKERGAQVRFKAALGGLLVIDGGEEERVPPAEIKWRKRGVRLGKAED
jgi:integrase